MQKRATSLPLVAGALILGVVLGWLLESRHHARDQRLVSTLHAAGVAGLCVNVLTAEKDGRGDLAQRLLESRLIAALRQADELIIGAAHPDQAIPDLIEGIRRTQRYALSRGMIRESQECDRILKFLTKR